MEHRPSQHEAGTWISTLLEERRTASDSAAPGCLLGHTHLARQAEGMGLGTCSLSWDQTSQDTRSLVPKGPQVASREALVSVSFTAVSSRYRARPSPRPGGYSTDPRSACPCFGIPCGDRGRQGRGFASSPRPPFRLLSHKQVEFVFRPGGPVSKCLFALSSPPATEVRPLLTSCSHAPGLCYPLATTGLWVLFKGTHLLTSPPTWLHPRLY